MRLIGLVAPAGMSRADWERVAGQWVDRQVDGAPCVAGVELIEPFEWQGGEWAGWLSRQDAGDLRIDCPALGLVLALRVPDRDTWREVTL